MLALIFLSFFLIAMIVCLLIGISAIYAVCFGIVLFTCYAFIQRQSIKDIIKIVISKLKTIWPVVEILLFIGMLTGLWRSSGTIAFFIDLGLRFSVPQLFLLIVFLITSILSYLLGTSFGIASTAGVIFTSMASACGVSPVITAGVILSGVYIGDRGAPTSSSASLVAAITETDLYGNVRRMRKTMLIPFALCIMVYTILSLLNPMQLTSASFSADLREYYTFNAFLLIPAIVMLILPLFKFPIRYSILISCTVAALITVLIQKTSLFDTLKIALFGLSSDGTYLSDILAGGGIQSMLNSVIMITAASIFAGLLDGTKALGKVQSWVEIMSHKCGNYFTAFIVELLLCMTLCNQSVTVLIGKQFLEPIYKTDNSQHAILAMDLENTGILISGIIPWNIACSIPLAMLGADIRSLPFALYLYLTPLCYFFTRKYYIKSFPMDKYL